MIINSVYNEKDNIKYLQVVNYLVWMCKLLMIMIQRKEPMIIKLL